MSSEEVRWITIDEFVEHVGQYNIDVNTINLWISNKYLTLKQEDGIKVAIDYRFKYLMYLLKSGKVITNECTIRNGTHIKTVNKNEIRKVGKKYVVYTLDDKAVAKASLHSAVKFAIEYDKFISTSRDSVTIRLNKQDILKLKQALKALSYQGKINNKFNNVLKRINDRDKNNSISNDSNNSNSVHVPKGHVGRPRKKNNNICSSDSNINNRCDMEQLKRGKVRNIKFSTKTRKYIMDKYNLTSSRLTYILCYTSDSNMEALKLIKEAGEYERELDSQINQLKEEMYVKPTNID